MKPFILLSVLLISTGLFAQEKIWPNMTIVKGANYLEFDAMISKTRSEYRRELMSELQDAIWPLAMTGASATSLAPILMEAIQTFDGMYDDHMNKASQGIPQSLAAQVKTELQNLINLHRISEARRQFVFTHSNLVAQMLSPRPSVSSLEIANAVDSILYGSYTIDSRRTISLQLGLENLKTGDITYFQAKGNIRVVGAEMAKKIFDHFHKLIYPDWQNPNKQLTWILPSPYKAKLKWSQANSYCRSQGARLPYASELENATLGGPYNQGGLPVLKSNTFYAVKDKKFSNNKHYLSTYLGDMDPRGLVRTNAGVGDQPVHYACVQGEMGALVEFIDSLWKYYREEGGLGVNYSQDEVVNSLARLLAEYDGHVNDERLTRRNPVDGEDEAVSILISNGYMISLP